MTDQRRNALIGLFVLGGLVCLGTLIVKFGESRWLFSKSYIVRARFDSIGGVREGTLVCLAGVQVGRVLEVALVNPANPVAGVVARMEITRKYRIPSHWEAHVDTPLMGQPIINILPPQTAPDVAIAKPTAFLPLEGEPVVTGQIGAPLDQVLPPEFVSTLQETVVHIGQLAESLKPAANAITALLEQRRHAPTETRPANAELEPNLYAAIAKLNQTLDHFNAIIGDPENQSNIQKTLDQFAQASTKANQLVDDLQEFTVTAKFTTTQASGVLENIDATITVAREDLDKLGDNLIESTHKLAGILDQINTVTRSVAEGKGTVGMLVNDPKFYEELLLTTQRLGKAADELHVLVKQWQQQGILGL